MSSRKEPLSPDALKTFIEGNRKNVIPDKTPPPIPLSKEESLRLEAAVDKLEAKREADLKQREAEEKKQALVKTAQERQRINKLLSERVEPNSPWDESATI